ncbi:uncharacterized protein LOC105840065 isoform X1 [Monomorium pharaonis]|uniref:uncharacterized protein LOC105840065 isoform X1 n=1 Tax=Monomorium pharaonis TaxID=307658 RepID=UPI0017463D2F|nr:uncharacterized protein LOC105840065 isoform X1 [Monomorium pharaonis]
MTVISVGAYEIRRDIVFSNANVASHRKSRSQNLFPDQPFIDKTVSLQTPTAVIGQATGQQTLGDVSWKDQIVHPAGFPIFHHQPIKQNSFTPTSFRDKPFLKDAVLKNGELRGERSVLRDNPFEEQSLTPEEIIEGRTYGSQAPLNGQLFTTEMPFKNLFRGQSSPVEQASFQKQATLHESPSISNSIKFYRDDYIKPIDLYERYKDIPTSLENGKSWPHTKYVADHAPRLSSMPMVPSSEYLLPLSMTPSSMYRHNPAMTSGMGETNSSASKMVLGPMMTSTSNCNTPVDSSQTAVPSISVSANQSSIVGHILTSLTTKPSSPVMATSIAPSAGNTHEPIYFHATKHGAVTSLLPTLSKLNNGMHSHVLSRTPKSSAKINEHDFKFLTLEAPKSAEIQSSMLNYILPEEHKSELKGIQNSFPDYAVPVKLKHDWPLQQFSEPETSSGYIPLSLARKTKFVLPTVPLSSISWPIEIENDVSEILPLKSIMPDAAARNKLSPDVDLPVDFTASIPNSLSTSTPNGISGSITDGISTGIPGSMTADIPASMPTLNLGQSLHHVAQLRQTQEARDPWYPTGLQLQLGGFGGINYTLHTGNPTTRPMEPGIAKAGLTLAKLPQPRAPAFAKIGAGYRP